MAAVLIVSSFVAASRVGGYAQSLALAAAGFEPRLIPTVLFGRHPGLGPPGGGPVPAPMFEAVLEGAEAAGAFQAEAVLTGYFAGADQVRTTGRALARAKGGPRPPWIVVDPILGDAEEGLYVRPEVEGALRADLVPRADLLAPNLFELGRLTGALPTSPEETLVAARSLGTPALVTSTPCGPGRIGALYVGPDGAALAAHARRPGAPKGAGDLLKAQFLAARLKGRAPFEALALAVASVAAAVEAALAAGLGDLSFVSLALAAPPAVALDILA